MDLSNEKSAQQEATENEENSDGSKTIDIDMAKKFDNLAVDAASEQDMDFMQMTNDEETNPYSSCDPLQTSMLQSNDSPLQKLFAKQRLELAMELRRLQFANRPVTSTETKTRLEEFFTSSISSNSEPTHRRNNPQAFRTDNMRNEIEALGSQHRVSSILQTARERLEATLQRFVVNTRPSTVTVQSQHVPSTRLDQSAVYTASNSLHASSNSLHSDRSNNLIVHQAANGTRNLLTPVTAWVPVVANHHQATGYGDVLISSEPWLTRQTADTQRISIEQIRREQIIDEISELVHQQLVSTTLESQFRHSLEQQIMQQLRARGDDGQSTREFLRSLNRTDNRIVRNDFTHLGIPSQAQDIEIDDTASTYHERVDVTGSARVSRPMGPSNSREIRSLQSELKELKSMMKLSFELQLDMQRSLRQELAALIAGNLSSQRSSVTNTVQNQVMSTASNEGCCVICTEGHVDTVFYRCGHMSTCYICAMTLKQQSKTCPVCRAPIIDILRTYRCNLE